MNFNVRLSRLLQFIFKKAQKIRANYAIPLKKNCNDDNYFKQNFLRNGLKLRLVSSKVNFVSSRNIHC